jgi:pseudouridylate synthase
MDTPRLPSGPVVVNDEVLDALRAGRPVVALESTIIAHGLPRPDNLAAARRFEGLLASSGVTPATIAVLDGVPLVGLDDDQLVRVATEEVHKASVRDLPALVGFGLSGATTVAATASLAAMAGIRVFATGGNGGVHRAAGETFDESADLTALARTPITVVAAGVKSILDVPATLERLETLGVPGLGYRTSRFPAFCCTDSGHQLEWSAPDSEAVAAVMRAHDRLGLPGRHPGRQPGPSRPATGPQTARTAPRRCVCSGGPPTGSRQGGHSLPAGAHRPVLGRGEPHGQPRPGREQRSRRPRHRSRVVRRR